MKQNKTSEQSIANVWMTPGELLLSYKTARNKQRQIEILAELNLCSESHIRKLLRQYQEAAT